jgi:ribosomal protein S18 acetylase RimI-like enzyme
VTQLRLREMAEAEWGHYRAKLTASYIRQRVDFAGESEEFATETAHRQMAGLWPGGRPAEGQHVFVAEVADEAVGVLWLAVKREGGPVDQGWIFDVEIDGPFRGRGYGRSLMQAAEDKARELGCASLGLNVFGGNEAAIGLYRSLDYQTAAITMTKEI